MVAPNWRINPDSLRLPVMLFVRRQASLQGRDAPLKVNNLGLGFTIAHCLHASAAVLSELWRRSRIHRPRHASQREAKHPHPAFGLHCAPVNNHARGKARDA
jgi:hypothetical protein